MAKSVKKQAAKPKAAAKPRKPAVKKAIKAKKTEVAINREQVAELAHRFFTERGHVHGYHEEDWFRAEQELRTRAF